MGEQSDRLIDNDALVHQKDAWVKLFSYMPYAGRNRSRSYEAYDESFGRDNWFPAHWFGGLVSRLEGYYWYEDAYYEFFRREPFLRGWIQTVACDVYDTAPSNVESGLDYCVQETEATHLQDIAIRRALTRLALDDQQEQYSRDLPQIPVFSGRRLIRVRGPKSEGFCLNPGVVPFHRPKLIVGKYEQGWWQRNSVEDAYQRNKVLVVHPDALMLQLAAVTEDCAYFSASKSEYFAFNPSEPLQLWHRRGKVVRREFQENDMPYCEIKRAPTMPCSELVEIATELLEEPAFRRKRLLFDELGVRV